MAKKKGLHDESYAQAVERARRWPSQISDMRAIVSAAEEELSRPDFEVRKELYTLLSGATTQAERDAVLRSYCQGLDDVDQEGRFELKRIWQVSFGGEWLSGTYLDGANNQVIVTTRPSEKSRKAGIYALKLESGKQRWVHQMKKDWEAWQPCLNQDLFFFTTSYCGGGDDDSLHPLHAISLETGKLVWKWGRSREEELSDSVGAVCGFFGGLIIIRDEETGSIVAFDAATGEERRRHPCSYFSGRQELFLSLGDTLCLQSRKREIVWLSKDGTIVRKLTLKFPEEKKGFIDLTCEDGDVIYVCVWDTWCIFDEKNPKAPVKSESRSVVYAVGKHNAEIRWSLQPEDPAMRFRSVLVQGKLLYLCAEGTMLVVEKKAGEVVRAWPYIVSHITDKLFFHTDKIDTWDDEPFTFYARDARTGEVQWQRGDFEFLRAENNLLFGKVGDVLVILDETDGRERASINLGEVRRIQFVDRTSFLVVGRNALSLFVLGGEV